MNATELLTVVSSLTAAVAAVFSVLLYALKGRSDSRYDELHRRAELSEMRASFEKRIAELTEQLMATEPRWLDANHLLIENQKKQNDVVGEKNPSLSGFLTNLNVSDLSVDPKLIFVLTPFAERENRVYAIIKETCSDNGFVCMRGDEENATGDILSHIVKSMVRARLVIANISSRNPNVFYELGIAHAMDKPTILVSRNIDATPFDIRTKRILMFSNNSELRSRLTEMLLRTLAY